MKKELTIKEFGDINNIFEVLHKNDEFFEALTEKKVADTEEEYRNDLFNLGIYGVSKFQYDTDYNGYVRFSAEYLDIIDFLKNCKTALNKWVDNIPEEITNFKADRRVVALIKEGVLENSMDVEGNRYGVYLENPYRYLNVKYKNVLNELSNIYEYINRCVDLLNDSFLEEMGKEEVYFGDDYQRLKYAEENNLLFDEEGYVI
jgi:hypothetical protein|nr:MAG TPA: hypothetical protein [Caudoviricetes sp.]